MKNNIRIALLGLGEVGQAFAEHFLEKIQEHGAPVEIVAIGDRDTESPFALGFSQNGVPVFKNPLEVVKLGDKVDIIFDMTHDPQLRQELRLKLLEAKNKHTVIATEVFAKLLWCFFDEKNQLESHTSGY